MVLARGIFGADFSAVVSSDDYQPYKSTITLSSELQASSAYLLQRDYQPAGTVQNPQRAIYQKYNTARIRLSGNRQFRPGDTLLIVNRERNLSHNRIRYQLVRGAGKAVVTQLGDRNDLFAEIITMWHPVRGGEMVIPYTGFEPFRIRSFERTQENMNGLVITHLQNGTMPYMGDMLIIDKGRNDGVGLGDVFAVLEENSRDGVEKELLLAKVIKVLPTSSTLVIKKLHENRLSAGDKAVLRMRAREE
ncbi:hypothetical protein CHISP_2766 [Chitinispirillum alkaliphilum]|nr:hypothetical protein CHISP_2766 [Chitinispirillum alkaliphilum]